MSALPTWEAQWIAQHLKIYTIKYAEVYNEVYDHMVSAVEEKRRQGDTRDVLVLFQETMDTDLGGYQRVERLDEKRKKMVLRLMVRNLNMEFFSHFRSMKALWLVIPILFMVISSWIFSLDTKNLIILIYGIAFSPFVYFLIYGMRNRYFRTIRTKRKPSLVNQSMFQVCGLIMMLVNGVFASLPTLYSMFTGQDWVHLVHQGATYLGISTLAIVAGLGLIYAKSVLTLIHTDYGKMIREVIPSDKMIR